MEKWKADILNNYNNTVLHLKHSNWSNDREFLLELLKKDGLRIRYINEDLKDDKDIALAAISNDSYAYSYISQRLQNDREVVMVAIKKDPWTMYSLHGDFLKDKEIVIEAVQRDGLVLIYADKKLYLDRDVLEATEKGLMNRICVKDQEGYNEIMEKMKVLEFYREEDRLKEMMDNNVKNQTVRIKF
jgi:hypothetical protein